MRHYAIGVTYNGAVFHGWQRQAEVPSVQGALEQALSRVADHPVSVRAAGRTDAGVHATGQVAAFSSPAPRKDQDWLRGVNALTPAAVRVDWLQAVDASFHPRYHATARRYVYLFHDTGVPGTHPLLHPLLREQVWTCQALNADAMHRAAQALVGEHDFSSFRAAGCQSLTPMRRVHRCAVMRRGEFVVMDIEANAFLLHMVRNIARALHDIGAARETEAGTQVATQMDRQMATQMGQEGIAELLARRDRTRLGATAPPEGLYLASVAYPQWAFPEAGPVPLANV